MEKVVVRGITVDTKESRITVVRVPDRPGIAARVFSNFGENPPSFGSDFPKRPP